MSTVTQIRDAFKATLLANLSGVQVYSRFEDVIEAPAVVVSIRPGNILHPSADFTGAYARGMDEWYFELHVFANRREGGYAEQELDQYVTGSGPKSIRQVLFNHPTLGLADTDATAIAVLNYGGTNDYVAGIPHVGASITVCVRTSGT